MRTLCELGAGDYSPSPTGSGGCSALLYNLILLPETESDLAGKELSVECSRALTAYSAKAQIYFESPSLCQDQPIT